jgi:hypothetical protein
MKETNDAVKSKPRLGKNPEPDSIKKAKRAGIRIYNAFCDISNLIQNSVTAEEARAIANAAEEFLANDTCVEGLWNRLVDWKNVKWAAEAEKRY